MTPGGGGYGSPDDNDDDSGQIKGRNPVNHQPSTEFQPRGSVHAYKMAQESA